MILSRRIRKSFLTALAATVVSAGTVVSFADDQPADEKPAETSPQNEAQRAENPDGFDDVKIERKDGQIIIVTPDGERHTVPIGSRHRWLNQIGPVLHEGQPPLIRWLAQHGDVNPAELAPPKYVIGVGVGEVPEYVWAQLRRPGQTGLVVAQVMPDSPALAAGIQEHDILLKANDKALVNQKSLTDVVQESVDKPILLVLLRAGEELTMEVTPKKNDVAEAQQQLLNEVPGEVLNQNLHSFGPGVLLQPDGSVRDLRQELESLRSQIDALQKSVDELKAK